MCVDTQRLIILSIRKTVAPKHDFQIISDFALSRAKGTLSTARENPAPNQTKVGRDPEFEA